MNVQPRPSGSGGITPSEAGGHSGNDSDSGNLLIQDSQLSPTSPPTYPPTYPPACWPMTRPSFVRPPNSAARTSRQAGVVAAGATAVAAGTSPPIRPIAGSVAVGATAIGMAADAVEQVVRPDVGKTTVDLGGSAIGVAIDAVPHGKLVAPLTNEAIEILKNSQLGDAIRGGVNQLLTEEVKK